MATTKRVDVIGDLYTSLCGDPELPFAMQWRIYGHAARAGKFALMARLLTIPNLDPALDAKLGEHDESKVRAAWIGRAHRPIADVLAALEKARKGPVYSAAAAIPDLPKEVYRMLVTDGRLDTAHALLGNADVPPDVKALAAVTYGAQIKARRTYRNETDLKGLFTDQLGLLVPLVSQTNSLTVVGFAAELVTLPAQHVTRILEDLMYPALANPSAIPYGEDWEKKQMISRAVNALLGQRNLTPEHRLKLYRQAARVMDDEGRGRNGYRTQLETAFERGIMLLPEASHPDLERMRNAETAEEVAAATALALSSRDSELGVALACNAATDATTVAKLIHLIPKEIRSKVAASRARNIDVLTQLVVYNDTPDLNGHKGWQILSDDLLAASGKPAEALISIVREYRASGKTLPNQLARSEYLTPSVMGALPLTFTSKKGSMLARRAVGDLLGAALDSDGDWEMFETLGNNFEGPLENLLLACGYIAAPTGDGARPTDQDDAEQEAFDCGDDALDGALLDPHGIATYALF